MDFAIVELNGKQYKISEGDRLKVDRVGVEEGKTFKPDNVLLYSSGKKVQIGEPNLKNVKVSLKVEKNYKDKKISVRRFRSKSRYRKNKGHRQPVSDLLVDKIKVSKA